MFHVDSGEIEGVDVADLTVAAVIDSPKVRSEGDWRIGLGTLGVETGEPARLAGIFHPLGTELTMSKSADSRLDVFGLAPALAGTSGFSTTFAWSG